MKINITKSEFDAIHSMIDLACQTVGDAEHDYERYNGKKRRGGYSSDMKKAEKFLDKCFIAFKIAEINKE